jgi:hypothetical protein
MAEDIIVYDFEKKTVLYKNITMFAGIYKVGNAIFDMHNKIVWNTKISKFYSKIYSEKYISEFLFLL